MRADADTGPPSGRPVLCRSGDGWRRQPAFAGISFAGDVSAGAGQAAAREVAEEAQHDVAVLGAASGDGPFVVVEVGQPPVAGGQLLAEGVEIGRWHGQQTDRLVVEVPCRPRDQPTVDVEGLGAGERRRPGGAAGSKPVEVDPCLEHGEATDQGTVEVNAGGAGDPDEVVGIAGGASPVESRDLLGDVLGQDDDRERGSGPP